MHKSSPHTEKLLPRILQKIQRRLSNRLESALAAPRYENPYVTHLPILIGLAKLLKIRRVIEFGCGPYSTLTFLNRDCFPDLETLHSFENDQRWAEEIGKAIQGDPRSTLQFFDQPMYLTAESTHLDAADLIFVDDSRAADDRSRTIECVVEKYKGNGIVVIHDYELRAYRDASAAAPYRFRFRAFNPNTGVVWFSNETLKHKELRRLAKSIRRNTKSISPGDLAGWKQLHEQSYRS